ncbi:Hypothetical protein A7982_01719 [Minicystis rosea]|nr:Hypothetical protein A7982_01719 [Minicystis rosea]
MRLLAPSHRFFGLAVLAAMVSTFPLAGGGCGRSACFVFSQGEYDVHSACPPMKSALAHFTDTSCPGPVMSVDGDGAFTLNESDPDQSLCCYPVTQQHIDPEIFDTDCTPPGTGGGSGIGGGFSSTAIAVGVGGGFMGCVTCSQLLGGVAADPNLACSTQATIAWQDLQACGCAAENACVKVCELNLCKNAPVSKECRTCLADAATSGCDEEIIACQSN